MALEVALSAQSATATETPEAIADAVKAIIDKSDQAWERASARLAAFTAEAANVTKALLAKVGKKECAKLLRARGVGRNRTYHLIAIADGRRTPAQIRDAGAKRKREHDQRKREDRPLRNGKPGADNIVLFRPQTAATAAATEVAPEKTDDEIAAFLAARAAHTVVNGASPVVTTKVATTITPTVATTITPTGVTMINEPEESEESPLDVAWRNAGVEERSRFLAGIDDHDLRAAMPARWRPEIRQHVLAQASAMDLVQALEKHSVGNPRARKELGALRKTLRACAPPKQITLKPVSANSPGTLALSTAGASENGTGA
jgi:hypothetical protein